jgi:glycerophosphoryl diester phosphodiesterase
MPKPWVVGHRGASGHAPENTMAAYRKAVELGAQFIETDLQLTRDARLVALHDPTLDRTTNGRGPVKDFTLAELSRLDAGSWYGSQFAGEPIPTLDDIIRYARQADVVFYLEVKTGNVWGVEHALVAALRDVKEAARTAVLSFDLSALQTIRRADAMLLTGLLMDQPRPDAIQAALRVGARQFAPRADLVTPELIAQAHEEGLQVVTWTINDPAQMRDAIAAGVDGIMTDYPDRLVNALAEK